MADMLQIWNMALGFVGTRMVSSMEENTPEAVQCQLFWDNARRQVLRDYPWNFARRRQWLAAVPLPEEWCGEYTAAFALPKDCLKVLRVQAQSRGSALPYALSQSPEQGGTLLLTSSPRALLLYTADITVMTMFDDSCVHVLARRLAALIAAPLLRENSTKINELEQMYRLSLPSAQEANASEIPVAVGQDAWLASRSAGGESL